MAADHTGFSYLSAFNDAALVIMNNIQASDLPDKKENNSTAYDAVFNVRLIAVSLHYSANSNGCSLQDALFKMYRFTIRAKMETYQSDTRLKNTVVYAERVNFLEESKRLLQEIASFN
jgi:hypothetical protein